MFHTITPLRSAAPTYRFKLRKYILIPSSPGVHLAVAVVADEGTARFPDESVDPRIERPPPSRSFSMPSQYGLKLSSGVSSVQSRA